MDGLFLNIFLITPKGVMHRTRAPSRTSVLVIEKSTIKPKGD
ncbi:MAG: hypothetical protein V3V33_00360 [Candidatus Lokiarchaeia archaeon]